MKKSYLIIVSSLFLLSCSDAENEIPSIQETGWHIGDSVHWTQKYIYQKSMDFTLSDLDSSFYAEGPSWQDASPSPRNLYVSQMGIFREPDFLSSQNNENPEEVIFARKHNLELWVGSNAKVEWGTAEMADFLDGNRVCNLYFLSPDSVILQEKNELRGRIGYERKFYVADRTVDVMEPYFFRTNAEALEYVRSIMPQSKNTYWEIGDSIHWTQKYTYKRSGYFNWEDHFLFPWEVEIDGGELFPFPCDLYVSEKGIFREPRFMNFLQDDIHIKEATYVKDNSLKLWVGGNIRIDSITGKLLDSFIPGSWTFFKLSQDTIILRQFFGPNIGLPYFGKSFIADKEYDATTAHFFDSDSMAIEYVRNLMR